MLMQSESDLEELDQPIAFPVIGRGRVLYALVGKGIYKENDRNGQQICSWPMLMSSKRSKSGF